MGIFAQALTKAWRTGPRNEPPGSAAMLGYNTRGRVGKPQAALYRYWYEHSEWVNAAIEFITSQIGTAEYGIVAAEKDQKYDKGLQREVRGLFDTPNLSVESFRGLIEPVVRDLLILDAGACEKERTYGGKLAYLHASDGARVLVNAFWNEEPNVPRYWWQRTIGGLSEADLVPFLNRDMVYMMSRKRTYSPVGLSLLETLKYTIDAELNASAYNTRQVQNAAPDGILDLGEGARPEQVEAFKSYWLAEVAGKGAMAFLGGTKGAKFVPFRQSNRDMQFLEWNIYLVRKVCAVFGLSPQDLGVTFDINRAQGQVEQDKTDSRGVRPIMSLIQSYLTREIVWDETFGGPANNLAFRFTRLNIRESKQQADINKIALAGMAWKAVNEARADEGRPPIGDPDDEANPYNKILANTSLGIVDTSKVKTAADVEASQPATAILPATGSSQSPPTPAGSAKGLTEE
jgi:phage portal protein BeeE